MCDWKPIHVDMKTRFGGWKPIWNPPWPHGTFEIPFFNEEVGCKHLCDGTNPGILTCPSLRGEVVNCQEDTYKSVSDEIPDCVNGDASRYSRWLNPKVKCAMVTTGYKPERI